MSDAKFTPGPWKVIFYGQNKKSLTYAVCLDDSNLTQIAETGMNERGKVNARLICAAPDMYEALKRLEESAEYWCEYDVPIGIVDRIKAAIAKAEGRE